MQRDYNNRQEMDSRKWTIAKSPASG